LVHRPVVQRSAGHLRFASAACAPVNVTAQFTCGDHVRNTVANVLRAVDVVPVRIRCSVAARAGKSFLLVTTDLLVAVVVLVVVLEDQFLSAHRYFVE
jgi:hypothetical protein